MTLFRAWRRRLRALVRRREVERELDMELRLHLELEVRENLNRGMDAARARREALLAFGGVDRFAEAARDVRRIGWLEDFLRDARHALRTFRRAPGFAAAAVLTLVLGAGATTAVFSVVHAVLLAPLPFADPERLVRLWEANPAQGIEHGPVSPGTFSDVRERSRTLGSVALHFDREFLISFGDGVEEVRGAAVSPALFELLGIPPVAGRTFAPETAGEPGGEVVIGYGVWQRWFGGAPDVVGRTITDLNYSTLRIIGVMPAGFDFPNDSELWFPLFPTLSVTPAQRQLRYYDGLARLRPGVTLEAAQAEAQAIGAALAIEYPASNAGWTVRLAPLDQSLLSGSRTALLVLLGLVSCLLLIACANVANLMVARAMTREHDVAVRLALGAGSGRLARQWLTEALLLATAGCAGGLALAHAGTRALIALAPAGIPRLDETRLDGPVLLFALGITFATTIVTGLAPALNAAGRAALDALRAGTRRTDAGRARLRGGLVGAQVALTLVLLSSGALLMRSFVRLRGVELGFERDNVMAVDFRVPMRHFREGSDRLWFQRAVYYDRLLEEVRGLAGVESAAGATQVPLTRAELDGRLWRTDAPGAQGERPPTSAADQWSAAIHAVTPDYFATLSIPVVRGRGFLPSDRFTQAQLDADAVARPPGVAVVNEAFVRRYFGAGDPLGRDLLLFDDRSFAAYRTIVGVVGDVRMRAVAEEAAPAVYLPFAQHPGRALSLVVRSALPFPQMARAVEDRLARHPEVSLVQARPLAAVVAGAVARPRFQLLLIGTFGLVALALAAVGIAGIVGHLIARRTRELGLRRALGAHPGHILRLVLAEGLRPVAAGVVVGLPGSIAAARMIRALLFGVDPLDATSFAAAGALLVLAAVAAALVPAARALRADPLAALRS